MSSWSGCILNWWWAIEEKGAAAVGDPMGLSTSTPLTLPLPILLLAKPCSSPPTYTTHFPSGLQSQRLPWFGDCSHAGPAATSSVRCRCPSSCRHPSSSPPPPPPLSSVPNGDLLPLPPPSDLSPSPSYLLPESFPFPLTLPFPPLLSPFLLLPHLSSSPSLCLPPSLLLGVLSPSPPLVPKSSSTISSYPTPFDEAESSSAVSMPRVESELLTIAPPGGSTNQVGSAYLFLTLLPISAVKGARMSLPSDDPYRR